MNPTPPIYEPNLVAHLIYEATALACFFIAGAYYVWSHRRRR